MKKIRLPFINGDIIESMLTRVTINLHIRLIQFMSEFTLYLLVLVNHFFLIQNDVGYNFGLY